MKLYVFSKTTEVYAPGRIVEEGKKRGHDIENLFYKDVSIKIGPDDVQVYDKSSVLEDVDGCVLRVSGQGLKGPLFVYQRVALIEHFSKNTKVVNRDTYRRWPRLNKLEQHYQMVRDGIPVIPSWTYSSSDAIEWENFKYPLIAKTSFGSSGQGVFKMENKKEVEELVEERGVNNILFQKFLPTKEDYRIIVIGGKAIPLAMKKIAQGEDFRTNYARGGKVEGLKLPDDMKQIAEKTAKAFDADYAGVDIMYDENNNPYVLEINRGAQFQGFEESTGFNVASRIIEYLEEK